MHGIWFDQEHGPIAHYAQAKSAVGLARDKLVEMIREAGKTPAERDALYNVVRVYN